MTFRPPATGADFRLGGRVHLVTGATGGIGRAVCHALATAGASVAALDRDAELTTGLCDSLPGDQLHLALSGDVADVDAHDAFLDHAIEGLGRLDGLVQLAAVIHRRASVEEITEADWDEQHDVNLKAAFFLSRAAGLRLRASGGGSITNFTSQAWWSGGLGGSVVYAASKGGVVSFSRGLARTFAPDQIRVNTVAPGVVETPMMSEGLTDEQRAWFIAQVPLGRMADPSEIAGAVVFLASDAGRYVTGATINVSGGQLMY